MQVTIKPGRMVDGCFVPHEGPGPVTPWWWQVDDDCAVYSGSCATETEAWCQASVALGWAPPPMVGRVEGVTARLSALQARAEAAEARAAQARADAGVLAVAVRAADDCGWLDQMQAAGLTKAEVNALDALYGRLADLPDAEMVAALRRTLGGEQ